MQALRFDARCVEDLFPQFLEIHVAPERLAGLHDTDA